MRQPQRPHTTAPHAAVRLGQHNTLHQLESLHCCCASQLIVIQSQVSVSDCRLAAAHKRDKYEARHDGNFRRIYPSSSAPLQAKYEWLLQGSARLFASSMKAKAHNTIGRIQVPPLAASLLLPLTIQNSMEDIMRHILRNMAHAPTGFLCWQSLQ